MKLIANICNRFIYWLVYIFTDKQIFNTVFLADPPKHPVSKTIYIIGAPGYVWSATMKCPCGCGEIIHLNLLPEGRPRWSHTIHKNKTVSLHPSVWRTKGCKSHFFMKKGIIEWCKSS